MCHQSVGLIARQLEAAGFTTVSLTSARTITAGASPPRATFVDAPLGHTAGPAHEPELQRSFVRAALETAVTATEPGTIVDLPYRWHDDAWRANPLSWSRSNTDGTDAGDTRSPRSTEPRYQTDDDRSLAEARSDDEQCLVCVGLEA